jgi:hypothetical protein
VYKLTRSALEADALTELEEGIVQSPHLGPSPLGAEFVRTEGFSIVFRRQALSRVLGHFPWLERCLGRATFRGTNAFYVNPLVLEVGSRADAHADCRVLVHENVRIVPTLVSVLYVHCPPDLVGGTLHLGVGTEHEVRIQPASGDLVHFKGDVVHSVSEMKAGAARVSIVCEQYNLSDDLLARYPELLVL